MDSTATSGRHTYPESINSVRDHDHELVRSDPAMSIYERDWQHHLMQVPIGYISCSNLSPGGMSQRVMVISRPPLTSYTMSKASFNAVCPNVLI